MRSTGWAEAQFVYGRAVAMPVEVVGTIDCGGETHRLQATSEGLRLLDHEDERQRILDALAGTSGCQQIQAAWCRLVHRYDDAERDDRRDFAFAESLIPDREFADWYDEHRASTIASADRLAGTLESVLAQQQLTAHNRAELLANRSAAHDARPLLELPALLRTALALQWIQRTLDTGGIRDGDRAQRLARGVDACWESIAAHGEPSQRARAALAWDIRAHRWPARSGRPGEIQPRRGRST
jgi:hypothetical protein